MAGKMDGWGGSAGVTSDMTAAAGLVLGDAQAQSMYQERLRLYHCANDGMEETHGTLAGSMPPSRPLSAPCTRILPLPLPALSFDGF
jgi:hypothetical protein